LGATVERMIAAVDRHDTSDVLACWHRRGIEHNPLFGELAVPDQLEAHLEAMFAALPDLAVDVVERRVDDAESKAIVRYRLTGTFTGHGWDGVDANGRALDIDVVWFLRFEDGFVVRSDVLFDTGLVSAQLGFRPGERTRGRRLRAGVANLRARWRNRGRADAEITADDDDETVQAA
ncbi:MAG: ester cyclase, partial [Acidimicrobiia bacterium]|nr:ester cyclase [Acidimicrobiia bacterium]